MIYHVYMSPHLWSDSREVVYKKNGKLLASSDDTSFIEVFELLEVPYAFFYVTGVDNYDWPMTDQEMQQFVCSEDEAYEDELYEDD